MNQHNGKDAPIPAHCLGYPIPINEVERIATLRSYEILDTPSEIEFDALTRLAATHFDTPVALVGMLDMDRIWFKSRLGLDISQLDRELAFCAYSVMQPGQVLVVEDLCEDERFCQNALVVNAPYLRFYAGAPIVDPQGFALGTIAIVDTKPRRFDADACETLLDLSTLVMTALENRRRSLILTKMALTDHLTGLANRAQFDRALEAEMAHAKRTGEVFSVICLDLDGFKDINDQFGHPCGDQVLCEVARRLQKLLRTEDTISRLGGDEFGLVIRESSQVSASILAQRITKAMNTPVGIDDGEEVKVSVSIGMASYKPDIEFPYSLLAQADSELYLAKRLGGKMR